MTFAGDLFATKPPWFRGSHDLWGQGLEFTTTKRSIEKLSKESYGAEPG